ncbi:hypothetical protein GCM10023094_47400 [Rhodococcus olei]|uniref:Dienelactone hydrolase domain-containing protein n=1 Tax=Rhodococcus olei TaxID=2161675 RepID=A0ABP8PI54_9NOCA
MRQTFRVMADRLADMGYVTLLPDPYYRSGDWAPFDMATVFTDDEERAHLLGLVGTMTRDRIIADTGSWLDFLLTRPEVTGSRVLHGGPHDLSSLLVYRSDDRVQHPGERAQR